MTINHRDSQSTSTENIVNMTSVVKEKNCKNITNK